jgi:hypothetical protein
LTPSKPHLKTLDHRPETFKNIGLRLKSGSLFTSALPGYSSDYKTADWTALANGPANFQSNPLYGQIFDGYDNLVRFGVNSALEVSDVDLTDGIAIFVRIIPDANASFTNANIWSLSSSPSVKPLRLYFNNGNLTVDINGTSIQIRYLIVIINIRFLY